MESCGFEKMDLATNHDLDSRQGGQATFNKRVKGLSCDYSSPSDCASIARTCSSSSSSSSSIVDESCELLEFVPSTRNEIVSSNTGCNPLSLFLRGLFCEDLDEMEQEEQDEEEEQPFSAGDLSVPCSRSTAVAKKKRVRTASFLPRIVKRDIRREICKMYANAVNSADKDFIATFFRQFCVPHCRNADVFTDPNNPSNIVHKQMEGVDNIITRICWHLDRSPDMNLQLSNVQIYRQLGVSGCRISMRLLISGTVAFKPDEGTTDMRDTRFVALSAPFETYAIQNTVILTLDVENRITHIQVMAEYALPSGFLA